MLDGLVPYQEENTHRIMNSMMDADPKGIKTKTEIEVPRAIAQLLLLGQTLTIQGATGAGAAIQKFVDEYLVLQVSRDRKGRSEIFTTLSAIIKDERSKADKLTSAPDSESI